VGTLSRSLRSWNTTSLETESVAGPVQMTSNTTPVVCPEHKNNNKMRSDPKCEKKTNELENSINSLGIRELLA